MLTLRCFGSAAVFDDTTAEELPLRSRKHLGLLLYLACHPRTLHTREELAVLLWDDTGPRERHSLSQALYDIRSKLGPVLEADTTAVQFRPDRLRCEAQQFEDAVERRDHEAALELFRGEFAPNLIHLGAESFDRWLDGERERHRVLAILALRNAQKAAEEHGDWDRSCLAALRLIRLNDFDEKSHRALMRGLWMKGDAASALAHYEALKKRWPDSAGKSLSSKTRQLAHVVAHRDQVAAARGEAGPLVGRDRELQTIVRSLDTVLQGGSRSLLLVGPHGIGKTHLLAAFARQARSRGVHVHWGPARHGMHAAEPPKRRATTLILDDADNLTDTDLATIGSRLKPLGQQRLLVIAAARRPTAPVASWLRRLFTRRLRVVELGPLPTSALTELLNHRGACPPHKRSWILDLAGGNPLYTLELARCIDHEDTLALLQSAQGANLRAALSDGLRSLRRAEKTILECIAALGPEPVKESLLGALAPQVQVSELLGTLAATGTLVASTSGWTIHPPILRVYISMSLPALRKTTLNLKAAAILEDDAGADSLTVARYYDRGSLAPQAHKWALGAARDAVHRYNADVAWRASDLALQSASVVGERLEACLLKGLARLERGQNLLAWHELKALSASGAMPDEHTPELHIALSSAAYALGNQKEANVELEQVWRDGAGEDRVLSQSLRLRAATIALHLARSMNDQRRVRHELARIDEALAMQNGDTTANHRWWLEALLARMAIALSSESLASAKAILSTHAHRLNALDTVFLPTVLTLKAVVSAKQGYLGEAATLLSEANANLGKQESTILHASLLNNLAAVMLEQGQFEEATRVLERGRNLDARLGLQGVFATHPYLNLGACALYSGQVEVADRHFKTAEDLSGNAAAGLTAQVIASRGLVALHRRDMPMADRRIDSLKDMPESCGWGEERFALAWFQGWYLATRRPADGHDFLMAAAETESARDVLSGAKLRFLAELARRSRAAGDEQLASTSTSGLALARVGVGWFRRRGVALWNGL